MQQLTFLVRLPFLIGGGWLHARYSPEFRDEPYCGLTWDRAKAVELLKDERGSEDALPLAGLPVGSGCPKTGWFRWPKALS